MIETSTVSTLVSQTALSQVAAVVDHMKENSGRYIKQVQEDLRRANELLGQSPITFDNAYLSLCTYAIAEKLLPSNDAMTIGSMSSPNLRSGIDVDFLLDIDLKPNISGALVISEWVVADILNCVSDIQNLSPLPLKLRTLRAGCVRLGFRFEVDLTQKGTSFAVASSDAHSALTGYFLTKNPEWDEVSRHFNILAVDINPSNKKMLTASRNRTA